MGAKTVAVLLFIALPAAAQALAVQHDDSEWVRVGPIGSRLSIDLGSRQWIAYGPQALVRTRSSLPKANPRSASVLQKTLLVNCAKQTMAVLDTEGLDSKGNRVFATSESGTPTAVGTERAARALIDAACSPPAIRVTAQ